MLKKYFKILSNPLLYYSSKEGNSVFRNYSLVNQTANLYETEIPKANIGKTLEYRFELDKYLKFSYFFITVILYIIFIHVKFSILGLLFFEFLWVILIMGARFLCSYLYHNYLLNHFGQYKIVEFEPPVTKRKFKEFEALFRSKIILIIICIGIFFLPSILLKIGMKYSLTSKFNGYKRTITLSKIHNAFYPKTSNIYDMRALAHYMQKEDEKSLNDYKMAIELSGKDFSQKDFTRFENLLLLQKRITSSTDAVDVFNEYITKKKMSVLEESQMLWIKSIFRIENNITDSITQDYDDMLLSLDDEKDFANKFYITSDKAYMLYLMQQYTQAEILYNQLISIANENQKQLSGEIPRLYAERGWTKIRLGDNVGATIDFKTSQLNSDDITKAEPSFSKQGFVKEKF